jgi:hypothetical protein
VEYASEILEFRQGFSRKRFKEETGWKARAWMRSSKIWCDDVGCVRLTSGVYYHAIQAYDMVNSRGSLKGGILLDLMNDNKDIKKCCCYGPSLHLLD